ncbi:MAG: hypothetical protein CM15mP80_01920 [Alphaproteobacteria bacterium]|nr:MAG: hypothetical protein CM15mP80_01920 [Alphaproteobacteria bacterium]
MSCEAFRSANFRTGSYGQLLLMIKTGIKTCISHQWLCPAAFTTRTAQSVRDLNMSVFPYEHGRPVGYNAQMGLIVLQSDETLEYELRRIFPEDGVAL